jgi:hypothetical protein
MWTCQKKKNSLHQPCDKRHMLFANAYCYRQNALKWMKQTYIVPKKTQKEKYKIVL